MGVCSSETCGDGKGCEGPNVRVCTPPITAPLAYFCKPSLAIPFANLVLYQFNTCCPDPKDWGSFEAPMTA